MISVNSKGDFSKVTRYMTNLTKIANPQTILNRYGKEGVRLLSSATPVDSGLTSSSWYYTIVKKTNGYELQFNNSNIQNGISIAIILQYGHGTGTGGWVEGRDYINPVTRPLFDKLANEIWKEVTKI